MSSSRLELVIDSRQAQRELDRLEGRLHGVERASDRTERSMQTLTGSISSIRTVAMAAGGWFAAMGVSSFGRDVFNTVAGIEKMRASLVTMTGSVEGANEAWEQMREFAKTTPFELEQSVQAFIRMKGMGLDPTEESMRAFANTAAATGKDLMQMVEAVADAATGEYERLKEFNIKSSAQGDEVAFTFQGVTTTIKNSSEEIVRYLENIGNTTFSGAAIAQVDTLGGKLNNLGDRVDTLYAAIGEAGATDLFNAALDGSAEAVQFLTDNVENLAMGVDLLGDAAIIAAGLYTGRFVAGMAAGTLSLANKTRASIADASATNAAAAAEIAFLRSVQGSLSAQLASSRSAMQRASLRKQLAANTAALTAANNTYTASLGRSTVAARAMGAASRGAAGAMALMGGPLGLLIGAGGLLIAYREELGLVRSAAEPTTQRIDNLTDALNRNSVAAVEAGIVNLSAEYFTLGQRAAAATAEIERLTAAQENDRQGAQARLQNNMRLRDLREELAQVTTEQEAAGKAATQLRETLAGLGETVVPTTNSLTDLDDTTLSLTDSTEKAADKTTTLADAYESLLDRITPNRREARQYAQDLGTLNLALASGRMTAQQYMQAMGMLQESFQAAQRETENTANAAEDASQRIANSFLSWETVADNTLRRVDDSGQGLWLGLIDGSESALDTVKRGFQQTLAEIAHMLTTQRLTFHVAGMMGLDTTGMPGGGSGGFNLNGISSLYNGAKKLPYMGDAISGIGSALGFGASAAAPIGYASGFGAAAATGTYTGFAGSAAAGAAAAGGGGLMGAASAAMPWVGGALLVDNLLGLGITDGIVKGISSLFGGGKTAPKFELATVGQDVDPTRHGLFENYGEGVYSRGALGTVGFADAGTARLEEQFDGFDNAKSFLDGITALDNAMVGVAANLDNGAEKTQAMASAAQAVRLNAGDAAGIADQLATRTLAVVDVLDGDFSASLRGLGLDAEQITGRVVQAANAMQLLDSNSARLNLQFDASAAGAMRAADGMAQLMGGADNLSTSLGGFYDAFYTEEEKLQHLTEDLSGTFSSMGRELPTTREGVRDVVESLELMGAAGQEQLATILQLNQPLAQYIAAMEEQRAAAVESGEAIDDNAESMRAQADIARERAGLEREWLQLQGNTEELRRRELAGIDESNRALQQRIWAFKDEQAAAEQAAQAQQQLMNGVQTAYQEVEQAVNAERQILENAYRATTDSISRNMQTVQDAMSTTERAADGLQSTLDQMMGASAAGQQSQFETASDYLRSVLSGGGLGDPDELDRALSAVANPSQDTYETLQDYQRDFLSTANVVDQLRDRADEQLTTEERSLRALERQLSQADLQFEREMSALDSTLETQREMLEAQFGAQEWLSTVNNSVLSVADAIAALEFKQAQAVAGGAGGGGSSGSGSSSLTNAQIKAFADNAVAESGGDWDAAGVAIGNAAIAAGVTSKQLADALGKTEQQVIDRTKELGLPGFASGGIATGPTSGYPVELHGTEAIIPLKGGNVPLHVPGIQALIREVSQLRKELAASQRAIAEHTRKSARVLEREEVERRQEEVV